MTEIDPLLGYFDSLKNDADFLSVAYSLDQMRFGSHWGFDNHNPSLDSKVAYDTYLSQINTNPLMKAHVAIYPLAKDGISEFPMVVETSDWKRPANIIEAGFKHAGLPFDKVSLYWQHLQSYNQDLYDLLKLLSTNYTGTVGIYNCAQVNEFIVKGKTYPAFRLNAKVVMNILHSAGYRVRDTNNNFRSIDEFNTIEEFMAIQKKNPSGTAVMLHLQHFGS